MNIREPNVPFDRLSSIVEAGIAAPSADNCVCFDVAVQGNCLLIRGNAAHATAPFDRRVLDLISIGAAVENMVIRARRIGYQASVAWFPHESNSLTIASMSLVPATAVVTEMNEAIPRRHTNRAVWFRGPALPAAELAQIRALVEQVDGVSIQFLDSPAHRSLLLLLVRIAEAERFNTQELHRNLFSAIRFDIGWAASSSTGLPPGALGIAPASRWGFTQLRHWPLMNLLRHLGVHQLLGIRAASLPCRLAPHCGVLTTRLECTRGATAVGVALERLWLAAESRGIAFQPLAGSALLALPEYLEVPRRTGQRLRDYWQRITPETPMMVFRMGYAKRPKIRTGRVPVSDVFESLRVSD